MKNWVLAFGLMSVLFLSACTSAATEEILTVNNEVSDMLDEQGVESDEVIAKMYNQNTLEDVEQLNETELQPLLDEIEAIMTSTTVETEEAQDLYELRQQFYDQFVLVTDLQIEYAKARVDPAVSEEEFFKIEEELDAQLTAYNESMTTFQEEMEVLAEEHDIIFEED
ncbi:hypothetical protein [Aureibacillus halotolerans]|uniref:Cell-wall binding lipoprotein n=1 Tax=Aureibacillus halotolerans TaxID=1508390 RepID=A0A4R6UD69_9BACI|nr:hypothetical protein [Aureibacillus halotolerans]TDQ43019.1 hypothetical protein EV213_101451 [Aureibacillus halotolerans]